MGATLSVWNGQYKMIPIYLSVEIQNSNYKIQNTKWYQSISLWQNKIQNDTIIIIFGIFDISISPFIWKEFWFTIPEGNFWPVSMMIDMKGGRTDSWVWFQILFMDGDKVGRGQILETGRYQVRSGFSTDTFSILTTLIQLTIPFQSFHKNTFPFQSIMERASKLERCYLVFEWYLRWYLVIATASAAISLMTSNSFQL